MVKSFVTVLALAGVWAATPALASAAEEDGKAPSVTVAATLVTQPFLLPRLEAAPAAERPGIIPALYVALGAVQVWDVYTTRQALSAGAREANPVARPFAGQAGSLLALKAATTASTIFFSERMWRKNKAAAIAMLVAVNAATAAVSVHNTRTASRLAAR